MKCNYCGKNINNNQEVCLNCGKLVKKKNNERKCALSLVGFLISIVTSIWALIVLKNADLYFLSIINKSSYNFGEILFTYLGINAFTFIPGLFALVCSLVGYAKKTSNIAISGVVFSSFSLGSCIYILLKLIKFFRI